MFTFHNYFLTAVGTINNYSKQSTLQLIINLRRQIFYVYFRFTIFVSQTVSFRIMT